MTKITNEAVDRLAFELGLTDPNDFLLVRPAKAHEIASTLRMLTWEREQIQSVLGVGAELDAEHNLAGLHSDIKDSDPVGAATLARVMSQIAKVKSLLAGIKE